LPVAAKAEEREADDDKNHFPHIEPEAVSLFRFCNTATVREKGRRHDAGARWMLGALR
jgi:hypothetical protein